MSASAPPETLSEILAQPHPVPALRKRVLVTGAAGMLGSDLVPVLAGAGWDVFALPKQDLDVTREEDVARAFFEIRPEIVVNCAAFTKVDACENDVRAIEVNARAVRRLADHCARHSAQLVQISTDFVFDGAKGEPYREEDPALPLSVYGASKLEGEQAALRIPAGLVVRSSWLFGPAGWNFIEAILKQVEEGTRSLSVVDDQRGRPTGTSDLSEAVLALLSAGAVGIYHFANRGAVSWLEFARDILKFSGRGDVEVVPIDSATLGRPARRPSYSVLDTGRYERVTGQTIRHYRGPLVEYLAQRPRPQA